MGWEKAILAGLLTASVGYFGCQFGLLPKIAEHVGYWSCERYAAKCLVKSDSLPGQTPVLIWMGWSLLIKKIAM
jgi:hypothetical protein